jgi:hypothetical protein
MFNYVFAISRFDSYITPQEKNFRRGGAPSRAPPHPPPRPARPDGRAAGAAPSGRPRPRHQILVTVATPKNLSDGEEAKCADDEKVPAVTWIFNFFN